MDKHEYKGWLNSDNFWKRAFAIIGYTYAAMFAVWLGFFCIGLTFGFISAIFTTLFGGSY